MELPKLNCNGCRKCCFGDTIEIMPEHDGSHKRWKTDFNKETGKRTLKKNKEGHCIYLGKTGCTIYGKQPHMCKIYDCRLHYMYTLQTKGKNDLRLLHPALQEGKSRLEQIERDNVHSE